MRFLSPRVLTVLLLPLLLAACPDTRPRAAAAPRGLPGGEWTHPFDGHLPENAPADVAVLHVVDGRTGEPVPGAVIRRCLEIDVDEHGWAPSVAELRTDAFGLASLRVEDEPWDAHWTVHALGHAATEAYGGTPQDTVELERPRRLHGRIVDAMGRPLAHARLGYKEGCGHAPFLVEMTTDADGVFVLSGVHGDGDVFYAGRGVLGSYFRGPLRPLDETPHTHVAEPCRRITGRVIGADPADLAPRMIHVTAESRGVFGRIGDDGSFVIDGADGDGLMTLWCAPDGSTLEIPTSRWGPGRPHVWDVRLGKREPSESQTVAPRQLAVEVLDSDGAPYAYAVVNAYRVTDGREAAWAERAPDTETGPLLLALLPGTYDLVLDEAGGAYAPPLRVQVGRDDPAPVTIHARPHPRLEVEGFDPEDDDAPTLRLAWTDADGHIDHETQEADFGTWVPAGVPARVSAFWDDGVVTFHDVGPVKDGVRRVTIQAPPRRTIRFRCDVEPEEVWFAGDLVASVEREGEDGHAFATHRVGTYALELHLPSEEHLGELPALRRLVTIAEDTPANLDLGHLAPPPGAAAYGRLSLQDAAGAPLANVDVHIEPSPRDVAKGWPESTDGVTDASGELRRRALRPGATVHFTLWDESGGEGRTVRRTLRGPSPWTVRLGDAVLGVEVHGRWGLLMSSSLMLDGVLQDTTPRGDDLPRDDRDFPARLDPARYVLEGLDAGPHVLIVTAPGHRGEARRVILAPGERRRIRIELPERE